MSMIPKTDNLGEHDLIELGAEWLERGGKVRWYSLELRGLKDWATFASACGRRHELLVPEQLRDAVIERETELRNARIEEGSDAS